MMSEYTNRGKVTIIDLILLISLTNPFGVALAVGWKAGIAGIAVGLVTGLIMGLGNLYGLDNLGYYLSKQIDRIPSDLIQNIVIGIVVLGMFTWAFGSGLLAGYIVELIIAHVLH